MKKVEGSAFPMRATPMAGRTLLQQAVGNRVCFYRQMFRTDVNRHTQSYERDDQDPKMLVSARVSECRYRWNHTVQ